MINLLYLLYTTFYAKTQIQLTYFFFIEIINYYETHKFLSQNTIPSPP
jgi:hypothetical protein